MQNKDGGKLKNILPEMKNNLHSAFPRLYSIRFLGKMGIAPRKAPRQENTGRKKRTGQKGKKKPFLLRGRVLLQK
jgi:hypothetical protein